LTDVEEPDSGKQTEKETIAVYLVLGVGEATAATIVDARDRLMVVSCTQL